MKGKMKKLLNRICASVLTVVMVAGMLPANVTVVKAATDTGSTATTGSYNTVNSLNTIMQYAIGLFNENKNIDFSKYASKSFTWDSEGKDYSWSYFNGVMLDAYYMLSENASGSGADTYKSQLATLANGFYNHNIKSSDGTKANTSFDRSTFPWGECDSYAAARPIFDVLNDSLITADKTKYSKALKALYSYLDNTTETDGSNHKWVAANSDGNYRHKDVTKTDSNWYTYLIGLDGLYMVQPLLMEYANSNLDDTADDKIYTAVYNRLHWIASNMSVTDSNNNTLYQHGWKGQGNGCNGVVWSRGVGWYAMALTDVISMYPTTTDDYKTKRNNLIADLKKLLDGMCAYQQPSGLWYNVIYSTESSYNPANDTNNMLETSGTAMMAYCLLKASNEEYYDAATTSKYKNAGLAAIDGIATKVDVAKGYVYDVQKSAGVEAAGSESKYHVYTTKDNDKSGTTANLDEAKGVGAMIMAMSEASKATSIPLLIEVTNETTGELEGSVPTTVTTTTGRLNDITTPAYYTLADSLEAGAEYVIASGASGDVNSLALSGDAIGTLAGTVDSTGKLTTDGTVTKWKFAAGSNETEGGYTITSGGKTLDLTQSGLLGTASEGTGSVQTDDFTNKTAVPKDGFFTYNANCSIKTGKSYTVNGNSVTRNVLKMSTGQGQITFKPTTSGTLKFTYASASNDTGSDYNLNLVKTNDTSFTNRTYPTVGASVAATIEVSGITAGTYVISNGRKDYYIFDITFTPDSTSDTPAAECTVTPSTGISSGVTIADESNAAKVLAYSDSAWTNTGSAGSKVYLYKEVPAVTVNGASVTFAVQDGSEALALTAGGESGTINTTVTVGTENVSLSNCNITWTMDPSDSTVATVANGTVTPGSTTGTVFVVATLNAVGEGDANTLKTPITLRIPVTVSENVVPHSYSYTLTGSSIDNATIRVGKTAQITNGTLTVKDGDTTLTENTDYTVTYTYIPSQENVTISNSGLVTGTSGSTTATSITITPVITIGGSVVTASGTPTTVSVTVEPPITSKNDTITGVTVSGLPINKGVYSVAIENTTTGSNVTSKKDVLDTAYGDGNWASYDIVLKDASDNKITSFDAGFSATVTITIPEGLKGKTLQVLDCSSETPTVVTSSVSQDGATISFTATHFSEYAIAAATTTPETYTYTVTYEASPTEIKVGETSTVTATITVQDSKGVTVEPNAYTVTWGYGTPGIVTQTSASGNAVTLTGAAAGSTTVAISTITVGDVEATTTSSGSATITVTAAVGETTPSFGEDQTNSGNTIESGSAEYILVNSLTAGKTYLIVTSNSAGGAYALKNPADSNKTPGEDAPVTVVVESAEKTIAQLGKGVASANVEWTFSDNIMTNTIGETNYYLRNDSSIITDILENAATITYDSTNSFVLLSRRGIMRTTSTSDNWTRASKSNNSDATKLYLYEKSNTGSGGTAVSLTTPSTITMAVSDTVDLVKKTVVKESTTETTNYEVEYTTENTDVISIVDGVITPKKAGTATIKVTLTKVNGVAVSGSVENSITVTVTSAGTTPSTGTTYKRATTFEAGKPYLIVHVDGSTVKVMTTNGTSGKAGIADASIDEDGLLSFTTAADAEKSWWTFTGDDTNGYTVSNGSMYIWMNGTDKMLTADSSSADKAEKPVLTNGYAVFKFKTASRYLKYSTSNSGEWQRNSSDTKKIYLYEPATTVEVTGLELTLDKETLPLVAGASGQITASVTGPTSATVNGETATIESTVVTWKSSDETVATVDDSGNVTAVGKGSATLTATVTVTLKQGDVEYKYTVSKTATVSVTAAAPTDYTITIENVSIMEGETVQMEPVVTATVNGTTVTPDYWDITWSIAPADGSVATINTKSGSVTGVKVGEATVTAVLNSVTINGDTYPVSEESDTASVVVKGSSIVVGEKTYTYNRENNTDVTSFGGNEYVMTYNSNTAKTVFDGTEIGTTLVSIDDKNVTINVANHDSVVWTLEQVTTDSADYRFKRADDKYLKATSSEFSLVSGSDEATTFTLTHSKSKYKVGFKDGTTTYYIAPESGGTWTISTSAKEIRFYKETVKETLAATIEIVKQPGTIKIGNNLAGKGAYEVKVTVKNGSNEDITADCTDLVINWASNATSVLTLDNSTTSTVTNTAKGVAVGTATVTAQLISFQYNGTSYTFTDVSDNVGTNVESVEVANITVEPAGGYHIRKYGNVDFSGLKVVRTYTDGTRDEIPFSELTVYHSDYNEEVADTYYVKIYKDAASVLAKDGTQLTVPVIVDESPYYGLDKTTTTPTFPNEGAVRIDKTATNDEGFMFNKTGITKVELDVAGISATRPVDVVLVVDVSNSMAWSDNWFIGKDEATVEAAKDADKIPGTDASSTTDKLDQAMATAQKFATTLLSGNASKDSAHQNTLSFVTFAGHDTDNFIGTDAEKNEYLDSVQTVFTGVTEATSANSAFANTKFTKYSVRSDKGVDCTLQIGNTEGGVGSSGKARGNTNYDYAFGQANVAVQALHDAYKTANSKEYSESGRETIVVFMTDGAPSHYNDARVNGSKNDALFGTEETYPGKSGTAEQWITKILNPNKYATQLKANDVSKIYAVGFDLNHGGFDSMSWSQEELGHVLEGVAGTNGVKRVQLATDGAALDEFFTTLASNLTYPGTSAVVHDIIHSDFHLELETEFKDIQGNVLVVTDKDGDSIVPGIEVTTYKLWTKATTNDNNLVGTRTGEKTVLEKVTRVDADTVYSSAIGEGDELGATNIQTVDGTVMTIAAANFTYTVDTATGDETFVWNLNNITDEEVVLSFYEKLNDDILSANKFDIYDTNEQATIEYVDMQEQYTTLTFPLPKKSYGKAITTIHFYLVNAEGKPVNYMGQEVPFANASYLTSKTIEVSAFDEDFTIKSADYWTNTEFPLYDTDPSAGYTLNVSESNGSGTLTINGGETKKATTIRLNSSSNNLATTNVAVAVVYSGKLRVTTLLEMDQVVIDYGKAVEVDVLKNDEAPAGKTGLNAGEYYTNVVGFAEYVDDDNLVEYTHSDSGQPTYAGTYGTFSLVDDTGNKPSYISETDTKKLVKYTPTNMISGVEKVYVVLHTKHKTETTKEFYIWQELDIIPATSVYYETDFANDVFVYSNGWIDKTDTDVAGNRYENATDSIQDASGSVYGYDSTYADDNYLSDGTSKFIEGTGVKRTYTEFTFTGKGFDLISRTGKKEGMIYVEIYDSSNTRIKGMSVLCKGELELYQIPVVSIDDLNHGTYTVRVHALAEYNYTGTNSTLLSMVRDNDFYFDAVRIWNPVDAEKDSEVQNAYKQDGEAYPKILEIRDQLLSQTEVDKTFGDGYEISGVKLTGALFIDMETAENKANPVDYVNLGPKNEVYLAKDHAVVFKLKNVQGAASIDIGVKSADGQKVNLKTIVSGNETCTSDESKTAITREVNDISSSTAQYYDLFGGQGILGKDNDKYFDNEGSLYVFVMNNSSEGILSLTDIKIAYVTKPTETSTLSLEVDSQVMMFASACVYQPNYNIRSATFTSESCGILRTATMEVVTTMDVENLVMTNQLGWEMNPSISYVDQGNNTRVWTLKLRMTLLGNQTYTVTGYSSDGTEGDSLSASIKVTLW